MSKDIMNPKDHPVLPTSYKGAFPFRIGTTSFIYPGDYVPNVRMLGPYLDEIELLFFESKKDSLPTNGVIQELCSLSNELNVSYNIHLPTDIHPESSDPLKRQHAVDVLKQVFDLTQPLYPTTYTLHLPNEDNRNQNEGLKRWQENIYMCLDQFIGRDVEGKKVSVETLSYPIVLMEPIINDFHLSVCLDVGHLILYGCDVLTTFNKWQDRTSIIHLHGVDGKKDHLSLDQMDSQVLDIVMKMLSQFKGVVSLEVFSFDDLKRSLGCLEEYKGDKGAAGCR